MVSARSAAMGFNRLVDARFDALNPRTAMRELPRGAMTRGEAALFVIVRVGRVRVRAPRARARSACALSPVALAIVFWYSLAKRYTTYTQLFLGLAMAVAPVGGWIAAGGGGRARAVAARSGDRALGGRLRHPLRLPGRRVRPRARPAVDSDAVRRAARDRPVPRDARRLTVVAMVALWRVGRSAAALPGGRRDRRGRCSSTSSRSSATTICRR